MNTCLEFVKKAMIPCFCALEVIQLQAADVQAGGATNGSEFELRLASDYMPDSFRVQGDPSNREIRSIEIVGKVRQAGDGSGEIWLDPRLAELNAFGDIVKRLGPRPTPVQVKLQYVPDPAGERTKRAGAPRESPVSKGSRLYDIIFPGGDMAGRLKLALAATAGPHRLLVYGRPSRKEQGNEGAPEQILAMFGTPATTSVLPELPLGDDVDLSGFYGAEDGRMHRVEMRGTLGGKGRLGFDINYFGFDSFGNQVLSTAMAYRLHEITVEPTDEADPLGLGRKRYRAIPKDPQYTNRVVLVLGPTETGPHRILVYRGDRVSCIVPALLMYRRLQEGTVSKLAGLPVGEQQAIADLRRTTGHGFRWEVEQGQVVVLDLFSTTRRFPPDGVLARLPQLRSVGFGGGRFPAAGVPDLYRLPQLRCLFFDGTEFEAASLATLKDLTRLEDLTFRDCRGISDEGVKHLVGLIGLKRLSFYTERLHRPSEEGPCVTDAGVAHLAKLAQLQVLALFGHNLSDRSVESLARMRELKTLSLSGHGFTDAGLEKLARLPKLRELRLFETGVTTDAVARLKERFPELKIEAWGLDSHD